MFAAVLATLPKMGSVYDIAKGALTLSSAPAG
jgi:hypothetical protein